MKSTLLAVALLCATALSAGLPNRASGDSPTFEVILTAYSCEEVSHNPMHPCGPPRWGGSRSAPGLACPVEWRDFTIDVPGFGAYRCDDTPREGLLYGLPHIDLRVPAVAEARRIGIRRIHVYRLETRPEAGVRTAQAAVRLAHEQAPAGDTSTAIPRLVLAARARQHFPALLGGLDLPEGHPVWLVTLWVPAEEIPAGAVAQPDAGAGIAARFFVFDAATGKLLTDAFVSRGVVEVMGWLPQDSVEPGT